MRGIRLFGFPAFKVTLMSVYVCVLPFYVSSLEQDYNHDCPLLMIGQGLAIQICLAPHFRTHTHPHWPESGRERADRSFTEPEAFPHVEHKVSLDETFLAR